MPKTWPIKWKLIGGIALATSLVMLANFAAFFAYEAVTFRREMVSNLTTLGKVVSINSTAALSFGDRDDATDVLSALSAEPHVIAAALYDRDGRLFAVHPRERSAAALLAPSDDGYRFTLRSLTMFQPVIALNRRVGTLYLRSDLGALYGRLVLYVLLVLGVMLLTSLIAWGFSHYVEQNVTDPVMAMVRCMRDVSAKQDYSVRAERFNSDELGLLADGFNTMLAEIQGFSANLEARVADRTMALEKALKALDAYSYTVSHDLRAPLRHIQGYGAMLKRAADKDCKLTSEAQRFLDTILTASADMGRLIDDLLMFSRMGRAEMRAVEFSMNELITETILGLDIPESRKIEWRIAKLPLAVGDQAMFKQVFANLIGNAVKYSRNRADAIIEIGVAGEENGRTIVFVRDNGAGFDQRYADKLFGVFQRLHRADEFEGTGIGLATVQQIVTRHGGRVWGVGEVGKGAMFSFTVDRPVAKENHGDRILEAHPTS